jgi:hypothetical protein
MMFVKSVPRSIQFYGKLGFEVGNSFTPPGQTEPTWAWLESGGAGKYRPFACAGPGLKAVKFRRLDDPKTNQQYYYLTF